MSKVKFALVGCGRIGVEADTTAENWEAAQLWIPLSHASAIQAVPGADLVAVCDTDPERAEAAASKLKTTLWFDDLDKLLAEMKPDAVAVATRTAPRATILQKCIDHGVRGFFCEKPLSLTLEDTDRIMESFRTSDISFVYGTRRRYMPVYQRAYDALWSGELGEPRAVRLSFGLAPLLWTHPHTVDLACFFARDAAVVSLEAEGNYPCCSYNGKVLDADPYVKCATIRFENGITAHIESEGNFDVEVSGSEGSVTVKRDGISTLKKLFPENMYLLSGVRRTKASETATPRETSGTERSIRLLVDALLGRLKIDPALALQNMEIIFAIAESIVSDGTSIEWPLKRRGLTVTGRLGDLYP
jgi:scyllo-inositol 2-dehydrogenase (NAD+)